MLRVCVTFGFLVAWLTIGSTAQAGFITVTSDGFHDLAGGTTSSSSPVATAERSPEPENGSRFLNWLAGGLSSGQAGTGMTGSSSQAPTGSPFAACE